MNSNSHISTKYFKTKHYQLFLVVFFNIIGWSLNAQNINSLLKQYQEKSYDDSSKLNLAIKISDYYKTKNPDSSFLFNLQAYHLANANNYKEQEIKLGFKLSYYYFNYGNNQKALNYAINSLKLIEQTNEVKNRINIYNHIGTIYSSMENHTKSYYYFSKFLNLARSNKDTTSIVAGLNNTGATLTSLYNYSDAKQYFIEALTIDSIRNETEYFDYYYSNLANICFENNEINNAELYFLKSNHYSKLLQDTNKIILNYIAISDFYFDLHNNDLGLKYIDTAYTFTKIKSDVTTKIGLYERLANAYKTTGDYTNAYNFHIKHTYLKDSVSNTENQIRLNNIANDYTIEQKEFELNNKAKIESQKQRLITWSIIIILLIVAAFTFLLYKRFKLISKQKIVIEQKEQETQLQNTIIKKQKLLVEEKHKEITDSINYAKRIQFALLPNENTLKNHFQNHFVYFNPKDVVSGDFYALAKLNGANNQEKILLCVADSTGHGVPGSIMSMLNMSCLNSAINADKHTQPADILNATRSRIIHYLATDGSEDGGKDGMDCSLISFDFNEKKLIYSAANNPILIVRASKGTENPSLENYPADRMPVGKHLKDNIPFIQKEIDLNEGDMVYMFTDGYADQFGGEKGKKFKYKQLEELLISISDKPMDTQKQILSQTFDNWKGNLEQVDDVCLIGVRI